MLHVNRSMTMLARGAVSHGVVAMNTRSLSYRLPQRAHQLVKKYDTGLKKFVVKSLMYTEGGFATVLGCGLAAVAFPELWNETLMKIAGGSMCLGGWAVLSNTKPVIRSEVTRDPTTKTMVRNWYAEHGLERYVALASLCAGTGLLFAPMPAMYTDPWSIALLLVPASYLSVKAVTYGLFKATRDLSVWKPLVKSTGVTLLMFSAAGTLSTYLGAPPLVAQVFDNICIYSGAPLFATILAINAQSVKQLYRDQQPDELIAAATLVPISYLVICFTPAYGLLLRDLWNML